MGSKYIPQKGSYNTLSKKAKQQQKEKETWSSVYDDSLVANNRAKELRDEMRRERAEVKKQEQINISEKARIEAIPLDELTFTDLYKLPFRKTNIINWVYDEDSNFCFQFERNVSEESVIKTIEILNDETNTLKIENKNFIFSFENGDIYIRKSDEKPIHIITIRGWGNLTGCGSYNLKSEYAAKIQDTLGNWIVNKLNNR